MPIYLAGSDSYLLSFFLKLDLNVILRFNFIARKYDI